MLHDFLTSNWTELTNRCREMVAKRSPRAPATDTHGISVFLLQVVDTLVREKLTAIRGPREPEPIPSSTEIGRAAALHGAELSRSGYSVGQVVHEYGDVLQAVSQLAAEQKALFTIDEFRTLNHCIDNATADAVTAFVGVQDRAISSVQDRANSSVVERRQTRGASTNGQQPSVSDARHTFSASRTGSTDLRGANRAESGLRDLIDPHSRERRRAPRRTSVTPPHGMA